MNSISVPLVLAKALVDVGVGSAAAFSFARTDKSGRVGIAWRLARRM